MNPLYAAVSSFPLLFLPDDGGECLCKLEYYCVQLVYYNSCAVELTVRPSGVRLILRLTADAAT
jgi:hypothetical protein